MWLEFFWPNLLFFTLLGKFAVLSVAKDRKINLSSGHTGLINRAIAFHTRDPCSNQDVKVSANFISSQLNWKDKQKEKRGRERPNLFKKIKINYKRGRKVSNWKKYFGQFQGKFRRRKLGHDEVASSASRPPASQDHQKSSQAEGRLRLRHQLPQERVQHSRRVPLVPLHLCCDSRSTFQWKILLLQWQEQGRCKPVPVRYSLTLLVHPLPP